MQDRVPRLACVTRCLWPCPPSRLNGSSLENHLENDGFSDKSERENAEDSDAETQDHSRKTNESGSDQSEGPGGPRRGTTYVEQVQEELGEVSATRTWHRGAGGENRLWGGVSQAYPGSVGAAVFLQVNTTCFAVPNTPGVGV